MANRTARAAPARPAERDGGFFEPSLTFLRVRGIPIGAHWSWLIVFSLIVWALGAQLFPRTYPGLENATYWGMAVFAAALFFGSVLLHELGHALRGIGHGVHMEGITLWLFGGVARFRSMFPSPRAEFSIAIAGPLISLGLAIGFGLLAWAGGRLGWPEPVRGVTDYLARINAIVLGFNMVPALPLDGGRVLRSWLWHRQGDFVVATVSAARAGRVFGMLLIGVGVLGVFTGAGLGGLWIAFIGWFLLQAAQAEASQAVVRLAFEGMRVRDLMTPGPETVDPQASVAAFLDRASGLRGHSTYPVTVDDRLVGMLSLRAAASVPEQQRATTRVADVMVPADDTPTIAPGAALEEALETLQRGPSRAVVVSEGRTEGILSRSDLARAFERRREQGVQRPPTRGAGFLVWLVVGIVMLLAVGYIYHPPVAATRPGPAVDITGDITISGVDVTPIEGRYLLTSVALSRPNGLGALYALVHPNRDLLPLSAVIPEGVDPGRFAEQQLEVFEQSRVVAAIAAARLQGLEVSLSGDGAQVVGVVPGTPAARTLERGDVIVGIQGRTMELASEVADEISSQPPGTRLTLTILRNGDRRTAEIRTARLDQAGDEVVGIGVLLQTRNFDAELPFDVSFRDRVVGGPSAGLAYALAITDLLDPADLAGGRTIAATGTVTIDGSVGVVGSVDTKAHGARDQEADLFLVPRSETGSARIGDLTVRGVDSLEAAMRTLRTTA